MVGSPVNAARPVDPAQRIVEAAGAHALSVATAESLTAGLVAARIADVPGASAVLRGGVISYANEVKERLLGVDADLLDRAGSVDGEVARQMAVGALSACGAVVAVSTTGAAGPSPHDGKPVGTVFVGYADAAGSGFTEFHFAGDRVSIRNQACDEALRILADHLEG
ncbi:CinA family protein [Paeniglutamicibacter cryotolerans]|uniref:Nicotinamide-nucleotide amidase n=1 Tax=Paeniglutamicibacter cryotolerans TaxID=670079 RepID=A0A839QVZ8_9MICC|nr:CinA family protein [Paeniglutamicibacter cryotolerans]MBB2996181.1 nicotinamide-nucleotide amidase [Paeniglutamicibacter cryotolerans]